MTSPIIISPVSRLIAVGDLARATQFYEQVLGFETRPSEQPGSVDFTRGPARIIALSGESTVDSTGSHQPRGSAVLFLQVDDVDRMRAEILKRGGNPGPVEKANWLKMRLFELRDPEGHVIWFGQSYHVDPEPRHVQPGKGWLRQMLPHLPLDNVGAGVTYYKDVLGFSINYQQDDLGVMDRDQVTLLLVARSPEQPGIGACTVYVSEVDRLHLELSTNGATIQGEPVSRPWGLRDFTVLDPEGNRITFAQPFE